MGEQLDNDVKRLIEERIVSNLSSKKTTSVSVPQINKKYLLILPVALVAGIAFYALKGNDAPKEMDKEEFNSIYKVEEEAPTEAPAEEPKEEQR